MNGQTFFAFFFWLASLQIRVVLKMAREQQPEVNLARYTLALSWTWSESGWRVSSMLDLVAASIWTKGRNHGQCLENVRLMSFSWVWPWERWCPGSPWLVPSEGQHRPRGSRGLQDKTEHISGIHMVFGWKIQPTRQDTILGKLMENDTSQLRKREEKLQGRCLKCCHHNIRFVPSLLFFVFCISILYLYLSFRRF